MLRLVKMSYLIVSYDLRKAPPRLYQQVREELEGLGDAVRANRSVFLLATLRPLHEVTARIAGRHRTDDALVIGNFVGFAHHQALTPEATNWLVRHGFLAAATNQRRAA